MTREQFVQLHWRAQREQLEERACPHIDNARTEQWCAVELASAAQCRPVLYYCCQRCTDWILSLRPATPLLAGAEPSQLLKRQVH